MLVKNIFDVVPLHNSKTTCVQVSLALPMALYLRPGGAVLREGLPDIISQELTYIVSPYLSRNVVTDLL